MSVENRNGAWCVVRDGKVVSKHDSRAKARIANRETTKEVDVEVKNVVEKPVVEEKVEYVKPMTSREFEQAKSDRLLNTNPIKEAIYLFTDVVNSAIKTLLDTVTIISSATTACDCDGDCTPVQGNDNKGGGGGDKRKWKKNKGAYDLYLNGYYVGTCNTKELAIAGLRYLDKNRTLPPKDYYKR